MAGVEARVGLEHWRQGSTMDLTLTTNWRETSGREVNLGLGLAGRPGEDLGSPLIVRISRACGKISPTREGADSP